MSTRHSISRAHEYKKKSEGELTIFGIEAIILAVGAVITYFLQGVNILGFSFFGWGGIAFGLLLGGGFGMIYTANNRHEFLHIYALVVIIGYIIGLFVEYFYPLGSWFVNVTVSGALGWFAGLLIGLFIFAELVLGTVDAHATHMR